MIVDPATDPQTEALLLLKCLPSNPVVTAKHIELIAACWMPMFAHAVPLFYELFFGSIHYFFVQCQSCPPKFWILSDFGKSAGGERLFL